MKIFGINFTTKKELKRQIADLCDENASLRACIDKLEKSFPFKLGQTVYDVALKNTMGRYTKITPSLEHSTITEVTVTETNYFSLVKRMRRHDVFVDRVPAEEHLKAVCK